MGHVSINDQIRDFKEFSAILECLDILFTMSIELKVGTSVHLKQNNASHKVLFKIVACYQCELRKCISKKIVHTHIYITNIVRMHIIMHIS